MSQLHIRMVDGSEHDVDSKPADFVRFEREFKVPMSAIDGHNASYEHMLYLGWLGLRRKNIFTGTFEAFIDVVDDCTGADPKVD